MWSEKRIEAYVKERLDENRFRHTLGVRESAVELARAYNEDLKKASIAALVHDCAKNMKDSELVELIKNNGHKIDGISRRSPQLLHGLGAAITAEKTMGIIDEEILNAVTYHTTGRKKMTALEKIIYLADYVEPGRSFPGVEELREASRKNLDEAMIKALDGTIRYVLAKGQLLHLDTIKARNYLLYKR